MTTDTTYNGYTNWETWHVGLLIDNEERTSNHAAALGKRCADIRAGLVKGKTYNAKRAADAFKKAFSAQWTATKRHAREQWPTEKMGEVNWLELAEGYMDTADEERNYVRPTDAEIDERIKKANW
jgi:hypothetical protein